MKSFFVFIFLAIAIYNAGAQTAQRHVTFRILPNDSVSLSLSDQYYLIEDSCAQIIRNGHYNIKTKKFFGKFKDVNKADPNLVVSEGNYTEEGLKEGDFTSYYLNGKLHAKGKFLNDKYDGKWEIYFDNGNPEVTFEAVNGDCRIIDEWNTERKKLVDNGNGPYVSNLGPLSWKGKLVNGKPDGRWDLVKTDDFSNQPMMTERFKKGKFHGGTNGGSYNYNDASHLILVDPAKLLFVNAEKMQISFIPCDGTLRHHIIGAQYKDGLSFFSGYISALVSPYLSTVNLKGIDNIITITGEVDENGSIINLQNNSSYREDIARGISLQLHRLPQLHPASIDGKPVRQKFVITFTIRDGFYQYTYRFLPIVVNN